MALEAVEHSRTADRWTPVDHPTVRTASCGTRYTPACLACFWPSVWHWADLLLFCWLQWSTCWVRCYEHALRNSYLPVPSALPTQRECPGCRT